MNAINHISIIGLGKLGSPMVACFAEKGFSVIGVDINPSFVEKMARAEAPVFEPGLQEMLTENKAKISATTDIDQAVRETDATFVIVPTPSDEKGGFSLKYVMPAMEAVGQSIKKKSSFHLVVLTSTVMPGSTGSQVLEVLEEASGKQCGKDFGLCYSPEFIALGNVIEGMLRPDFNLIGESDENSGQLLEDIYARVCDGTAPAARMNWVNAELTKISVNTFVTTKISYANMLAEICEKIPGADVLEVTRGLGMDKRIGGKYLKGALGYGGPCFPRDNIAFTQMARDLNAPARLSEVTHEINVHQVERVAEKIISYLSGRKKVAILGLSYKPQTNVIECSQGIQLAEKLANMDLQVSVYDPAAMENARRILEERVQYAKSAQDCVADAEVTVIMTPWEEFKDFKAEWLKHEDNCVLIDCWRTLKQSNFPNVKYVVLGCGNPCNEAVNL